MATNPLSAASLCSLVAASLPPSASPQLSSPTDAIAVACHAGMLAVGFRLIGLGEDHRIEAHSDPSSPQPLPAEWNSGATAHSFRYKHAQSSLEYVLKATRLGSKTVVYGIGVGDDKTASFDMATADFVSGSALPATPAPPGAPPDAAARAVQTVYISPARLADLAALLRLNVIQRLMPGLQKEGYEETSTASTRASQQRHEQQEQQRPQREPQRPPYDPLRDDPPLPAPARPHPLADPLAAPPRRPVPDFAPPGFEDEHEMLRPRGGFPGAAGGGAYDPSIGERDLYPPGLGPRDPLRVGGGVGGLPRPGAPSGGMHPTFDDPLFAGPRGGGGGYDPRAPPGARYDPVGPGDGPPRGAGGRYWGPGGGGGGGPPNPFSGFGSGDFI